MDYEQTSAAVLRDDEIEVFERDGAVCLRDVIAPDWLDGLRDGVAQALRNALRNALRCAMRCAMRCVTQRHA